METFKYEGPMRVVAKSDLETMLTKIDKIEASFEPGTAEIALKGLATAVLAGSAIYFMTRPTSAHAVVQAAKEAKMARTNENIEAQIAEMKRVLGQS